MFKDYIFCFKKKYNEQICGKFKEEFGYMNDMQILKIDKVVINMGVGEVVVDFKKIKIVFVEMEKIVGQKFVVIKVCKLIVGFKLCEDMLIGCKVMFCWECMYEFLDCLINIVLLCVKDFCGLNGKSFDGCGNFVMGFKE